jgi:hypothetical protein
MKRMGDNYLEHVKNLPKKKNSQRNDEVKSV